MSEGGLNARVAGSFGCRIASFKTKTVSKGRRLHPETPVEV